MDRLEEVEAMQKGLLPKKNARDLLDEIRSEERKNRISESFNKAVKENGEALKKLSD